MSEKIYLGSAREKHFDTGGSVINVHLTLNDIKEYYEKYGYKAKNGDKRIKINITPRRETGMYGETHNVTLDTWTPDGASNADPFGEDGGSENGSSKKDDDSDIPF